MKEILTKKLEHCTYMQTYHQFTCQWLCFRLDLWKSEISD